MKYTRENLVLGMVYRWTANIDEYTLDKIEGNNYYRHTGEGPSKISPKSVDEIVNGLNNGDVILVSIPTFEIY